MKSSKELEAEIERLKEDLKSHVEKSNWQSIELHKQSDRLSTQEDKIKSLQEKVEKLEEDRKQHFQITHQWGIGEDVANLQEQVARLEKRLHEVLFGHAVRLSSPESKPQDSRREVIKRARCIVIDRRMLNQAPKYDEWCAILEALTIADQSLEGGEK